MRFSSARSRRGLILEYFSENGCISSYNKFLWLGTVCSLLIIIMAGCCFGLREGGILGLAGKFIDNFMEWLMN